MKSRTYRYFSDKPLYSFGFGLSYTNFTYGRIKMPFSAVKAGDPVTIEGDLKNSAPVAGDEVVELYLTQPKASDTPIRAMAPLHGFILDQVSLLTSASRLIPAPSPRSTRMELARYCLATTQSHSAVHSRVRLHRYKPERSPLLVKRSCLSSSGSYSCAQSFQRSQELFMKVTPSHGLAISAEMEAQYDPTCRTAAAQILHPGLRRQPR
jgi:hypothetical protein